MKRKNSKKGKKIKISMSKRSFYSSLFLTVVVLVALVSMNVYALSAGGEGLPGHNIAFIDPPTPCADQQAVKWTGSGWECFVSTLIDTKCDVSGVCSDIWLDGQGKTSWTVLGPWQASAGGIYQNQNVGIGISDPISKLTVQGEIRNGVHPTFNSQKLWGTGGPGVDIISNWVSPGNGEPILVGTGNQLITWETAQKGCPIGSWVCSWDDVFQATNSLGTDSSQASNQPYDQIFLSDGNNQVNGEGQGSAWDISSQDREYVGAPGEREALCCKYS